jgi:hypothetical protein
MNRKAIREGAWLAINVIAGAVFVWLASKAWVDPPIWHRSSPAGGDPAAFGALVVKFLAPILLFNTAWLACSVLWSRPRRDWLSVWTFTGLGFMWTGLIIFNASKVGN